VRATITDDLPALVARLDAMLSQKE